MSKGLAKKGEARQYRQKGKTARNEMRRSKYLMIDDSSVDETYAGDSV